MLHFDIISNLNENNSDDDSCVYIRNLYSIKTSRSRIEILEPIKQRKLNQNCFRNIF